MAAFTGTGLVRFAAWAPPTFPTPLQPCRPAAIASALSIVIAVSSVPCTTSAGQVISPRRPVMSSRVSRQRPGSTMDSCGRDFHFAIHVAFSASSAMMMLATVPANSSTGPTDAHMSIMPWYAAATSGCSAPA